jgi:3-oxoacyl-[acyl-carrier protein] reductase
MNAAASSLHSSQRIENMGRNLLKDQVAVITGAGQGLGQAVAREFCDEGACVALVDINPETVAATEKEMRAKGCSAKAYAFSVSDWDAYQAAVEDVVAQWGKVDIIVNNAAISFYDTILNDNYEQWRQTLQVNLDGYYIGVKQVVPHMVKQKYGRIINVSSIQGFASSGDCGAYNASKGGIIAFTKSLAVELAPYNIACNVVAPGFMKTPMSVVRGIDETETPDFLEWYCRRRHVPMARTGLPEDVAGTIVFAASDYCRYMTGQVLTVDGGLTSTF